NAFTADQLTSGPFFGVRSGAELLAAGGTHVVARPYGIAAIGNVYTRPEARGRGYAGAITAALVAALFKGRCRDVILNVAEATLAARRIYERLGFRIHCEYREGPIERRRTPTAPVPPARS